MSMAPQIKGILWGLFVVAFCAVLFCFWSLDGDSVADGDGGISGAIIERNLDVAHPRYLPLPRRVEDALPSNVGDDVTEFAPVTLAKPLKARYDGDVFEPEIFDVLRSCKSRPLPRTVTELANELTRGLTNDFDKAEAIYKWLANNIKYDMDEWRNIASGGTDYTHEHDPESVLERGNTVCIGYAWLFDDMCRALGIESDVVIGRARGFRGTADEELVNKVKHAWNAVKIDDEWRFLDATWGALQEGESAVIARDRMDSYFNVAASDFLHDHLPDDSKWDFSSVAYEGDRRDLFAIMPNLKAPFWASGAYPSNGSFFGSDVQATPGEPHKMSFTVPEGVNMAFMVSDAKAGANATEIPSFRDGELVTAVIPELSSGDYLLRIFTQKESPLFTCSGDYVIHVK